MLSAFSKALAVLATAMTLLNSALVVRCQEYKLTDDLTYKNFFTGFDFFSEEDPTKGFVHYLDSSLAIEQNLIGYLEDTQSVFLGVDYTNPGIHGRKSVRVESIKYWNQGVLIADIVHMPTTTENDGCSTWPAYWLLGKGEWPMAGEIDILEGVNDYDRNAVTLHTSAGCMVDNTTSAAPQARDVANTLDTAFSGTMFTSNCDVQAPDQDKNKGCSISAPAPDQRQQEGNNAGTALDQPGLATYGASFNKAGGGVYAMEWTSTSISVWFFQRNSDGYNKYFATPNNGSTTTTNNNNSSSPSPSTIDPTQWGTPIAKFSGEGCDFTERFKDLRIVFDTTFCGEWAGQEWSESCAKKTGFDDCASYVSENSQIFAEAYWEIKGLRWYQKEGEESSGGDPIGVVPTPSPTPTAAASVEERAVVIERLPRVRKGVSYW